MVSFRLLTDAGRSPYRDSDTTTGADARKSQATITTCAPMAPTWEEYGEAIPRAGFATVAARRGGDLP
jgi:hypothetical protein